MRSVWSGKPAKNATQWKSFNNIRGVVIFLSLVNVGLKGAAAGLLYFIHKSAKAVNGSMPNTSVSRA